MSDVDGFAKAGKVALLPRGTWDESTEYDVLDVVLYENDSYVAIAAGTGKDPSTETGYWQGLTIGVTDAVKLAIEKAALADVKAALASEKAALAAEKAALAATAAENADTKANAAVAAANVAVNSAEKADEATTESKEATSAAKTATTEANAARDAANTAAKSANDKAALANTAAETADKAAEKAGTDTAAAIKAVEDKYATDKSTWDGQVSTAVGKANDAATNATEKATAAQKLIDDSNAEKLQAQLDALQALGLSVDDEGYICQTLKGE